MPGQFPLPLRYPQVNNRDLAFYPAWSHIDVRYWASVWTRIRDCILGSQEIKGKTEVYLPRLNRMTDAEYVEYLNRAVFFNMTDRTVNAMVGSLFQRRPKILNVPTRLQKQFQTIAKDGLSIYGFLAQAVEELLTTGRYGVFVDMDESGQFQPFITGYVAENILDWQVELVDGRWEPTQIVLREFHDVTQRMPGVERQWVVVYRFLVLLPNGFTQNGRQDYIYQQHIYVCDTINSDITAVDPKIVTPMNRGRPFNRIPFKFIGSKTNTAAIDRPPLAGIADLNLSHYQAYAILEHGRYYTGMPVWFVQRHPGSEEAEYYLGSNVVWETAIGEKPGILEFNGSGLVYLENSLDKKEEQIALLGGRLMGGTAKSTSESDNQAKIKEGNERALLLMIASNTNEVMSEVANIWARWMDELNPTISIELNIDFLSATIGARELRAAHSMYAEGLIPLEALHAYLQKAEVIPEWMDIALFKQLLDKIEEFPNQPDVWARMVGFSTAKDLHDFEIAKETLAIDARSTDAIVKTADIQQQVADADVEVAAADVVLKRANAKNVGKTAAPSVAKPKARTKKPAS